MKLARIGKLVDEPLPGLLFAMYRDRTTGVLSVSGKTQADVYIRQGYPAGVTPSSHCDQLGEVMLGAGMLTEDMYRKALLTCIADGVLFGQSLVKSGALSAEQLVEALRLQIRRRLHRLFLIDEGDFSVQTGEHWVGIEGPQPLRVQPRRVIYQGILGNWSPERLRYALRCLDGRSVRLRVDPDTMSRYGLTESDAKVASVLEAPMTLDDIVQASGQPLNPVRVVLATLLYTEALEVTESAPRTASLPRPILPVQQLAPVRPSTPGAARPKTPAQPTASARKDEFSEDVLTGMASSPLGRPTPPSRAPANSGQPITNPTGGTGINLSGLREIIAAKLKVVEEGDLFEVLGLRRDADPSSIKAAYLLASKMLHPDRFSGPGLDPLRSHAERIFKRLGEAYVTLRDDARRAAYIRELEGKGTADQDHAAMKAILMAESAMLDGETRFKRRDYLGAVEPLSRALELNPDAGEARSLLAWARFASGRATLAEVKPELRRAVQQSPDCARVHLYLGKALTQENELVEAHSELRKAVVIDDRLDEAWSELRLVATRREKAGVKGAVGMLDRLKRK